MVGRTLMLTLTMAAVAFAGCTAGGDGIQVPAPTWEAGYTWSYDAAFSYAWSETYNGETDNDTYEGTSHDVYQVLNTTYAIEGQPMYLMARQFGEWGGKDLFAVRQSDLAEIWLQWDARGTELELEPWTELDQIPVRFDFPMQAGSSWSQATNDGNEELEIMVRVTSRVVGAQVIDLDLGSVDTIRVDRTITLQDPRAVAEAIKPYIEEDEGVTLDRVHIDFLATVTEYYAPLYQNVVQTEVRSSSAFTMEGEEDGEAFEFTEESISESTEVLVGADLTPRSEQSLDQVLTFLVDGPALDDPVGTAVEEVAFQVAIEAVTDHINVAEGESALYRAESEDGVPEGHRMVWSLIDLNGNVVQSGDGNEFRPAPAAPGSYRVVLLGLDAEGDVVSGAEAGLAAHFRTQFTMTCGVAEVVGVGVPSDCQAVDIPVYPGIATLDVQATTDALTDSINIGTIRVTDVVGVNHDAANFGDAKHLRMAGSDGALGGQPWSLDWYQTLGVLEDGVEMDLDLTYQMPGQDLVHVAMAMETSARGVDVLPPGMAAKLL